MDKMMDFLAPPRASPSKSTSTSSVAGNSQEEQAQGITIEEGAPVNEPPLSSTPAADILKQTDADWPSHVSSSYFVVIADVLIVWHLLIAKWTLIFWAKFACSA